MFHHLNSSWKPRSVEKYIGIGCARGEWVGVTRAVHDVRLWLAGAHVRCPTRVARQLPLNNEGVCPACLRTIIGIGMSLIVGIPTRGDGTGTSGMVCP